MATLGVVPCSNDISFVGVSWCPFSTLHSGQHSNLSFTSSAKFQMAALLALLVL